MDEGGVISGEVCTQLMLAVPTGWAGWGWWRQIATPRYTSHITPDTDPPRALACTLVL